jgi:hypothetical protein
MVLSRDCDQCEEQHRCQIRYRKVKVWDKVSCPDGSRHLVDEG